MWPLADVEEHWTSGSSPNMKETAALITKTPMPSASNNDSDQMIDPGGFQGSSTGLLHESISPRPRSPRPSFRCAGTGSQMSQKRSPGRMNVLRPNPLSRQDSGTVSEFENIVSAFLVTKKNPLLTKIKDQNRRALAENSEEGVGGTSEGPSSGDTSQRPQRPDSLGFIGGSAALVTAGSTKHKLKRIMTLHRYRQGTSKLESKQI